MMEQKLRAHIEEIISVDDREFEFISSLFVFKKYKKHQFLIQEGEPVKYIFFVKTGLLKLVYTDDTAKAHIIDFAMEGWWETDFKAYYTKTMASMTLECIEDTEVYCLDLESSEKLRKELPKMNAFFLDKAYKGYIAAQQRILSTMMNNTAQRYQKLLERYPGLVQRVPKSLLAAYLGVSRETLSRLV